MCVCVCLCLCARARSRNVIAKVKKASPFTCTGWHVDGAKEMHSKQLLSIEERGTTSFSLLLPPPSPFGGHKRACVAVLNTVKQCHHTHRARQLQQLSCVTRFVQFTQTGVVTVANIIGSILLVWLKCFTTRLLTLHVFPHCNPARRPC